MDSAYITCKTGYQSSIQRTRGARSSRVGISAFGSSKGDGFSSLYISKPRTPKCRKHPESGPRSWHSITRGTDLGKGCWHAPCDGTGPKPPTSYQSSDPVGTGGSQTTFRESTFRETRDLPSTAAEIVEMRNTDKCL
jgi:hypothetical protein